MLLPIYDGLTVAIFRMMNHVTFKGDDFDSSMMIRKPLSCRKGMIQSGICCSIHRVTHVLVECHSAAACGEQLAGRNRQKEIRCQTAVNQPQPGRLPFDFPSHFTSIRNLNVSGSSRVLGLRSQFLWFSSIQRVKNQDRNCALVVVDSRG